MINFALKSKVDTQILTTTFNNLETDNVSLEVYNFLIAIYLKWEHVSQRMEIILRQTDTCL